MLLAADQARATSGSPPTRARSLILAYLGQHVIKGVVGMPDDEGVELVASLVRHATQDEFVYCHKWRPGDLLMWDNRQTMHRVRPFDDTKPRDMRRTTLAGDAPTIEQVAA